MDNVSLPVRSDDSPLMDTDASDESPVPHKRLEWCRCWYRQSIALRRALLVTLVAGFVAIGVAIGASTLAGHASGERPSPAAGNRTQWIHISLDGFRASYFDDHADACPTLHQLASGGVHAKKMQPAFPSATFPNHYTIATGLFPETHGIVANDMFDPHTNRTFSQKTGSKEDEWWGGEPIWVTAEKWGIKAGIMFWPGSEAKVKDIRPTYYMAYNGDYPNTKRVDQLLEWMDKPEAERPGMFMLYMSDVDTAGHHYGPDSPEVIQAIRDVDTTIAQLIQGLRDRGLYDSTDIVVSSDHGMTAMSPDTRTIYLDDYVDMSKVHLVDWGIVTAMIPHAGQEQAVIDALKNAHPNMTVYRKNEIPNRFHYQANDRIAPVIAVAQEGWSITTRTLGKSSSVGAHGFDNTLPSMQALFLARGPGFVVGSTMETLNNVDLYPLACYRMRIAASPNNGSLDALRPYLNKW